MKFFSMREIRYKLSDLDMKDISYQRGEIRSGKKFDNTEKSKSIERTRKW
jgi:hypothetical protein